VALGSTDVESIFHTVEQPSKPQMKESPVGSDDFRKKCVDDMKESAYSNYGKFFERYLSGEDFTSAQLEAMGYDHWSAFNIDSYIHHEHDGYYGDALCWE
jgi:hypothetical protein